MKNQLLNEDIRNFALAGKAIITLQSGNTNKYFTYKIDKAKETADLFYIRLLHGPDNEQDYQYVGCYYSNTQYFLPCKTWKDKYFATWPTSLRAIKFLLEHIDNIPNNLYVYHEGKCGRCGRKLTTPDSIKRGLGPECYKESLR